MSPRQRANCNSVLPLQGSWCSLGVRRLKSCLYHSLAVLLTTGKAVSCRLISYLQTNLG